jgi:protein TonB
VWDDAADHKFRVTNYDQSGHIVKIDTVANNDENEDKVFTKSEIEAQFPGGPAAWSKYITRIIEQHVDEFTRNDYGTCQVVFIVRKDGKVTDVRVGTMKGTKLADIALAAIANGPDWIPAMQNGHKVNAYRIQPVTLLEPK